MAMHMAMTEEELSIEDMMTMIALGLDNPDNEEENDVDPLNEAAAELTGGETKEQSSHSNHHGNYPNTLAPSPFNTTCCCCCFVQNQQSLSPQQVQLYHQHPHY